MTETRLYRFFFEHWQRKIVALFTAIIAWLFVNHSITDTKMLPNIPIRIINMPTDYTIIGLLPDGTLSKRITLTLTGTRDVIKYLEPSDLEVVLDASTVETDEWIVDIGKKNLISLNPDINLASHIVEVEHPDFVIHFSRLVTAKIPITILPPIGEAPSGYEFLDIWPQKLFQTITGSEKEVEAIQAKKLQFELDLSAISKSDLDAIKTSVIGGIENNEVVYVVPQKMKKINIPLRENEDINDPEAKNIHITFLRKQWLPLEMSLPIRVYYPVNTLETLNPGAYPLAVTDKITNIKGITLFKQPLYLYGVSKLFLEVVKRNLEIDVVAAPREEREMLEWGLNVIDALELENNFVAMVFASDPIKGHGGTFSRRREQLLRHRFRTFLEHLTLYSRPEQKLILDCTLEDNSIHVK